MPRFTAEEQNRLQPLLDYPNGRPGPYLVEKASMWFCQSCGADSSTSPGLRHKINCAFSIHWAAVDYLRELLKESAALDSEGAEVKA